jgi:O-antigen/teichoic acid export membrane protein
MTFRALPSSAADYALGTPAAVAVSRPLRDERRGQRVFVAFTLSVAALHASSLLANAFALRWIDPASMGVWHTLLLAASYLGAVRLGVVNGMGRELPFALGSGDVPRGRRIAATALACNTVSSVVVGAAFLVPLGWSSDGAWRLGLCTMAVVSATNFYFAYLQATFRSGSDFARLARVYRLQAALFLLMPVAVHALGFRGLCLHAALQSLLVTAFAHAVRPLRVLPRFEARVARELLVTGLPLFAAGYLQVVAAGFDRVILLHHGGVEAVGYYAPAVAILSALAVVPGAVATYVYPRMSYALGQGRTPAALGRMALTAAAVSVGAALPLAVCGWFVAPPLIESLFPQYAASVPAVRWSLVAGTLWGLAPTATLLSSLKAWRSLALYIGVLLAARWTFPWLLARPYEPLAGVARGNACAAAVAGALSVILVLRAMRPPAGGGTA